MMNPSTRFLVVAAVISASLLIFTLSMAKGGVAEQLSYICGPHMLKPTDEFLASGQSGFFESGNLGGKHAVLLNGPATQRYRDNLKPDVNYITTWPSQGWTNQLVEMMNLVYLAHITERVPILPPFKPAHDAEQYGGKLMNVGEIFDVLRLQREMKMPVLEWHQVKNRTSDVVEKLHCWSLIWESRGQLEIAYPPKHLGLDISYTGAPSWTKHVVDDPVKKKAQHTMFWAIVSMMSSDTPNDLVEPRSVRENSRPDDHLACFDNLYFTAAFDPLEYKYSYSPTWRVVGQHLHWTAKIEELAEVTIRQVLSLNAQERTPPYISVHIRRTDFAWWCPMPVDECFAPLSTYANMVEQVKAEILEKKNISVEYVIVSSDEKDAGWWKSVRERGWFGTNQTEILEKYGAWYPAIIDVAIQSKALGFVGTAASSLSHISRRRVETWQGGASRMVSWGGDSS